MTQTQPSGFPPELILANGAPIPSAAGEPRIDLAIVILNYNTAGLLRACLHSVYRAQGVRFAVCVVDNASSDNSAEMVAREFPQAHLIEQARNAGYSAGNNVGLRWFGFGLAEAPPTLPRYALLLNPDTLVPPDTFARMVAFMDARPQVGAAGPRVRRLDGSLDLACRRSFPTPQVSFYRMVGLSRLFRRSARFNAYNLEYLPEDAVHPVDSVVGAYMQVRAEAVAQAGLLDEAFFMYGEDLDWAKRFKAGGWEVWYNGACEMTHVKEAASSRSPKSRVDFYEAMWLFYLKHYRAQTNPILDKVILAGIVVKGGADIARSLRRSCLRLAEAQAEDPRAAAWRERALRAEGDHAATGVATSPSPASSPASSPAPSPVAPATAPAALPAAARMAEKAGS